MLAAIEAAVVNRIAQEVAPVPVRAMPAGAGPTIAARAEVTAAIVELRGESSQLGTSQIIVPTLEVGVVARSLRDSAPLYALWGDVLRSVLLWRQTGMLEPWRLESALLQSIESDTWMIVAQFRARLELSVAPVVGCPQPDHGAVSPYGSWAPYIGPPHRDLYTALLDTPAIGNASLEELVP